MNAGGTALPEDLSLADIEGIRLVLNGSSTVDWPRLHFATREEVELFLGLSEFDLDDERDTARLWELQRRAVDYMERTFRYSFPAEVVHPETIADLFLFASCAGTTLGDPLQTGACVILKVMHIINHLDARELGFLCPVSDRELFQRMEEKIMGALSRLRASGLAITEVTGGRKLKDSLITKLLSKRETLATQIYDKLRFRIIVETPNALVPLVRGLTRELFPFNYAVPGQSENQLVDPRALAPRDVAGDASSPAQARAKHKVAPEPFCEESGTHRQNAFSGPTFRDINFVADIPLRLPDSMLPERAALRLGRLAFVLVEFQLLDLATARNNERGENAHERYRARQLAEVAKRIFQPE